MTPPALSSSSAGDRWRVGASELPSEEMNRRSSMLGGVEDNALFHLLRLRGRRWRLAQYGLISIAVVTFIFGGLARASWPGAAGAGLWMLVAAAAFGGFMAIGNVLALFDPKSPLVRDVMLTRIDGRDFAAAIVGYSLLPDHRRVRDLYCLPAFAMGLTYLILFEPLPGATDSFGYLAALCMACGLANFLLRRSPASVAGNVMQMARAKLYWRRRKSWRWWRYLGLLPAAWFSTFSALVLVAPESWTTMKMLAMSFLFLLILIVGAIDKRKKIGREVDDFARYMDEQLEVWRA